MGIPIDPEDFEYGINCLTCFPAGKTPKFIYATFSGLIKGFAWNPGDPDSPNDTYKMEQVAPCQWTVLKNNFRASLSTTAFNTSLALAILVLLEENIFSDVKPPCDTFFENDIIVPGGNYFYNGMAQTFWRPDNGEDPSLSAQSELMNISQGENTFAEVWPIDADNMVTRFANQIESTNILMKVDPNP